jgi:hypothetical protein
MKDLSNRIKRLFGNSKKITLKKGGPYYFINNCSTKIDKEIFEFAIEYQISEKNKKRVTIDLIDCLYKNYQKNGKFLERYELKDPFKIELKSRPCNYSVAKFIVNQLIEDDNLNK